MSLPTTLPHGAHGASTPSNLGAMEATARRLDILPEVAGSLPPSVLHSLTPVMRDFVAEDGQFDCEVAGYRVEGVSSNDMAAAVNAMDRMSEPLPEREIGALLARLRVMTKVRAEEVEDVAMSLKVYAMELVEHPGVVVRHVLKTQPSHCKWWPAWEELQIRLEHHGRRLRQLGTALRRTA